MRKSEQSLETKYLEEKKERYLELIGKEDIYLINWNKEMKYLMIGKKYLETNLKFNFVPKNK